MLQEAFPFVSGNLIYSNICIRFLFILLLQLTWNKLFKELFTEDGMKNKKIYVISRQYLKSISDMISKFQAR